jgi:DNA-binding MarR family transcriptional regulator
MRNISDKGSLDSDILRFGELLKSLGRVRSLRDPLVGDCVAVSEFTHSQTHVLMWLGSEGSLTMGELARMVGITEKTITGVVDRLERDGLLQRTRDAVDRRVVRVALTKKGSGQYRRFEDFMRGRMGQLLGFLDPPDRDTLFRILNKLCERVTRVPPPPPASTKETSP